MSLKQTLLSEYGSASVLPSPVNSMMESFAADFRNGIDINLGVGYVNEDTIPKQWISEACLHVLSSHYEDRPSLNYGAAKGSKNLIESLQRFLISNKIGGLNEHILAGKNLLSGPMGRQACWRGLRRYSNQGLL